MMFSPYVFAFEATSALLITAAVGAMVLAHRERLTPKPGQRTLMLQRMKDYAETGKHPGPLAAPGVYARHNAVDTPALLPDGSPAPASVSRVLAARGSIRTAPDDVEEIEQELLSPSDEGKDDQ
jgi:NADH-quinone oxidoreductase subunit J